MQAHAEKPFVYFLPLSNKLFRIVRDAAHWKRALSVPSAQIYVLCQLAVAALKNQIPQ